MIKSLLKKRVDACFDRGVQEGVWTAAAADKFTVEVPKHEGQGDFSTNLALVVAGLEKRKPREIATLFAAMFAAETDLVARVEIAGPGFVNFFLQDRLWTSVLAPVYSAG